MRHLIVIPALLFLAFSCAEVEEEEGGQIMEYNEDMDETSAEDEDAVAYEEEDEDFAGIETIHVLHCNIGLYQEPAIMVLNWSEPDENRTSSVEGYYYYVRHQKKLDLKGFSDSRTRGIYLTESYKGKESGYMEFYQDDIDDASYWAVSKDATDHQEFNSTDLFFQEPEEANIAIEMEQLRYPHGIQVYNGEDWDDEEVTDELNYMIINDEYFAFDIHVTRANAHMGSISGYTKITDPKQIIYIDDEQAECKLTFDLSSTGSITVTENDCGYYHGARAQFDGTYLKQ